MSDKPNILVITAQKAASFTIDDALDKMAEAARAELTTKRGSLQLPPDGCGSRDRQ
jgi:hypothetical protein